MFIYTVKASRLKFFALVICSMAILFTLASVIPRTDDYESVAVVAYDYGNISTNDDRVGFLAGFGYEVLPDPIEVVSVNVPEKFDSVFETYNDIQRAQGLNLKRYAGKELTRYSYTVANYDDGGNAVANLLIYNSTIVGGDICRTGEQSFLHGFEKPMA